MEDLFKQYLLGFISWDVAYVQANNNMVRLCGQHRDDEFEYWVSQVQDLAETAADKVIKIFLGTLRMKTGY